MNTIKPLNSTDYDVWIKLWDQYLAFYETAVPEPTSKVTFGRLTDNDADYMGGYLCRDEENHAVGLVHWILHPSTWTSGDYCYLQDLYVSEYCRGKGYGRQLIDTVNQLARTRDCDRVYWLTHHSVPSASGLTT